MAEVEVPHASPESSLVRGKLARPVGGPVAREKTSLEARIRLEFGLGGGYQDLGFIRMKRSHANAFAEMGASQSS